MLTTSSILAEQLQNYSDSAGKIMRMADEGSLFRLTRGLYETDPDTPGHCLAGAIYGPSYLSFEYALSVYGLIPEAVHAFTSATFGKRKKKEYNNIFGRFTYRDVPEDVYPYGIVILEENGYPYQMATREKALCDKLYTMPPVSGIRDPELMLFDDLRIDEDEFSGLDSHDILQIGEKYRCDNLKYLMKYMGRRSS